MHQAVRGCAQHSCQRRPGGRAARLRLVASLLATCLPVVAHAIGTPAGTDILNRASAAYSIAGTYSAAASNTAIVRVAEKLDVHVSWQDAASVAVASPDSQRVTTFLLTNTGNGNDRYALSVNNGLGGDQFDPLFTSIYLDTNANGLYDPGVDALYVPGSNDPQLAADAALFVFVLNDIPSGLTDGDLGDSALQAVSATATGLPGSGTAGAGDSGTAAVVGVSGGRATDSARYAVSQATVALVKAVTVRDPQGGTSPVTGATLQYRIDATVTGSGVASAVVVSDALPANTSYRSGTLALDSVALTDVADADAGDFDASAANTITVHLGDLPVSTATRTITFEVTIN